MSNIYAAFQALLPDPNVYVGVVASSGGGACMVTLIDGGQMKAMGTASVGARVFIKNGMIESTAPTLTLYPIEI